MNYRVHGILQARILEKVAFPFSRGSIEPRSPILQGDSLTAEPQGKPKNTGVSSLSLLQRIFPTQGSNWGLLHCRQILYQLNYEGSYMLNSWRRKWQPTPVFLPGEPQGQRSLVGCCLWGCTESDTTDVT